MRRAGQSPASAGSGRPRSWCGPGRDNMATVFRPLERLRAPRPSLHPGVTSSGSACGRCPLGGTRGLTRWKEGWGWERRERETPAAPLFGEGSGDLSVPSNCTCVQPGLLGGRERRHLVPGKQRAARVWTRKGPRCPWRTFLTHWVSFSARFWYPSRAVYILKDSRQPSSSPKLFCLSENMKRETATEW